MRAGVRLDSGVTRHVALHVARLIAAELAERALMLLDDVAVGSSVPGKLWLRFF